MRARIRKWGNSLAVRIPHAFAVQAGLDHDAPVELSVEDGRLVIAAVVADVPNLDELLAGVTPDNLHAEVESGLAQGSEIW